MSHLRTARIFGPRLVFGRHAAIVAFASEGQALTRIAPKGSTKGKNMADNYGSVIDVTAVTKAPRGRRTASLDEGLVKFLKTNVKPGKAVALTSMTVKVPKGGKADASDKARIRNTISRHAEAAGLDVRVNWSLPADGESFPQVEIKATPAEATEG